MSTPTPAQLAAADQALAAARATVDEFIQSVITPAVPCDCGDDLDSVGHISVYARDFAEHARYDYKHLSVLLAEAVMRLALIKMRQDGGAS